MTKKKKKASPAVHTLRKEETILGGAIGWQKMKNGKGRGVFARRALRKGEIIEISPVVPVDKKNVRENGEAPDGYLLMWDENKKGEEYSMPLGYIMMYNHSDTPNIELHTNHRRYEITVKTLRAIKRGEELVWDYKCEIWFDDVA